MSASVESFQLSVEAAELYETNFVPALFGEWAPDVVDAARVSPGQAVLDVACGTGVVARTVADRMRGRGRVVGLDLNEGMLAVARRLRPDIHWQHGDAGDLPFADASFDVVLCQAALMFFPDRARALREMSRVVVAEGTVALQVWADLEAQPGYGPFTEVVARHAGPEAIDLVGAYWTMGDPDLLGSLLQAAGLRTTGTRTRLGTAKFASIDVLVKTEIEGTPLIDRIDRDTYGKILEDARSALASFVTDTGAAEIPIRGHIVTATR